MGFDDFFYMTGHQEASRQAKPSKAGQGMACMCAFISYSILLLLFIAAFLNTQYDQNESVYRTVTDVVLSCPKWLVFSRVQLQLARFTLYAHSSAYIVLFFLCFIVAVSVSHFA